MRHIQGSNVAVVGGAGFLGSHLVDHLINERDCSVLVIDNLISGQKKHVHWRAKFVHHDITTSESYTHKLFCDNGIEYVLNYSARPYIPDSFERPLHVFDINAFGALKVINAAQEAGCKGILQVSSAEIYGEGGKEARIASGGEPGKTYRVAKMGENSPVIPHSSYGASKAAIDAMVQVRWKEAGTPCIALRQFNCIGERETHPYVVPEIISQIYKGLTDCPEGGRFGVEVHLGNNSVRDFQYAGDAVRMAVELLEKGEFGEVYNMGSEDSIKIYDLAEMIGEVIGFKIMDGFKRVKIVVDESRKRPWEIWHLQADNTKLHSVIDYRSETTLIEAIEKTVGYFRDNENRWDWGD